MKPNVIPLRLDDITKEMYQSDYNLNTDECVEIEEPEKKKITLDGVVSDLVDFLNAGSKVVYIFQDLRRKKESIESLRKAGLPDTNYLDVIRLDAVVRYNNAAIGYVLRGEIHNGFPELVASEDILMDCDVAQQLVFEKIQEFDALEQSHHYFHVESEHTDLARVFLLPEYASKVSLQDSAKPT